MIAIAMNVEQPLVVLLLLLLQLRLLLLTIQNPEKIQTINTDCTRLWLDWTHMRLICPSR